MASSQPLAEKEPDARTGQRRKGRIRTAARWLLSALYLAAGIAHLTQPAGFVAITPAWVPWPAEVIALTGVAEIAGAIGLHIPHLRRAAGVGLALYALCVWPANLNHAVHDIPLGGLHLGWWYHGPRLLLQPFIIWWALWASMATDWPFSRQPSPPPGHPYDTAVGSSGGGEGRCRKSGFSRIPNQSLTPPFRAGRKRLSLRHAALLWRTRSDP